MPGLPLSFSPPGRRSEEEMRKKANERAMLEQKAKEEALKNGALDFYRQLREHGLKPFDGASIDFHRKRDLLVFIPGENPVLTAVRREELLNFLKANDIHRVLVDVLFPSRVLILIDLLQHGIEVYALRRPSALAGFKAMLERRYNKKKNEGKKNKGKQDGNNNDNNNGIKIPRKNDFIDAVALAFTWPKFHRHLDLPYVECWRAMNKWRRSYMLYYKVQQMLSEDEDESPVVTLHEDRVIEKAKGFVDTVKRHFPDIRRVFEEVEIPDDDVIAQALCCEIVLETYHIEKVSDVLRKAGIGIQSVPKKVRKKREEVEKTENRPKRKVFQYDGKLLFAANQLAVKLFHLNPRKEPEKVMLKTKKLLEEIWRCSRELQMTEENGRVGEALGVSGPSRKERDTGLLRPAVRLGPLRKQGNTHRDGAFQGPKHPADR
jgi:hypothetical protein